MHPAKKIVLIFLLALLSACSTRGNFTQQIGGRDISARAEQIQGTRHHRRDNAAEDVARNVIAIPFKIAGLASTGLGTLLLHTVDESQADVYHDDEAAAVISGVGLTAVGMLLYQLGEAISDSH